MYKRQGQEHVFHGIRPPIQMGGNHGGKGERRWPFPFCGQMTDDSRLPQDSGGDEGGILHNISGDRAQLLGGPPAGTGHQDGVKAALLGELDDLRSRAAEAQGGGRLIPGEHLGKGFHQ